MKLPFYIPGEDLLITYEEVYHHLHGSEEIVFAAMEKVTNASSRPFVAPTNHADYATKSREIQNILRYPTAVDGLSTAFNLMEEIYLEVLARGGLPRLLPANLLEAIVFKTRASRARVRLTSDLRWAAEWAIQLPGPGAPVQRKMYCDIYQKDWGEVVPGYVAHYVHSSILAYEEDMAGVAMALLSIAVEATLRDVLKPRGYTFRHGASSVPIYAYTEALVDVDASADQYTIQFPNLMPKVPSDVVASFPNSPVKIKIRRYDSKHNSHRMDLHITAPLPLIDHWSVNTVVQHAEKVIGGLGTALDIARNIERIVTPADLPTDFDEVLQAVRNNLVHLSGQALDSPLPRYNGRINSPVYRLREFLNDTELLFDFMVNIPTFISTQYVELRKSGNVRP